MSIFKRKTKNMLLKLIKIASYEENPTTMGQAAWTNLQDKHVFLEISLTWE